MFPGVCLIDLLITCSWLFKHYCWFVEFVFGLFGTWVLFVCLVGGCCGLWCYLVGGFALFVVDCWFSVVCLCSGLGGCGLYC